MNMESKSTKVLDFAFLAFCLLVFWYLIFPILIIIPISFSPSDFLQFPPQGLSLRWYKAYFGSSEWLDPTWQSLKVAVLTMILSTVLGTLAAFGLVKGRFRGKNLIQVMILLPMIIPQIIFAIGVYFLFASWHLVGKTIGLVLGHLPLALPFSIVTISASLYGFDFSLEEAAQTLGANRLKTFLHVTYPIIQPGILAGALFAFIISFDELIVALFICGTRGVTLPKRMFDALRFEISPVIASISSLLIVLSILVLLGFTILKNRSEKSVAKTGRSKIGGA
jgi:putative spermidine/putrescine transport system permease protein